MAIATVSKYLEHHIPGVEIAQVIFTDGDTYRSVKFNNLVGGNANLNGILNAATAITVDLGTNNYTRTAVLRCASASNATATIVLWGYMGN